MPEPEPPPEGSPPEPPEPPEPREAEPPPESPPATSIWYFLTFLVSPALACAFFGNRDDEEARAARQKAIRQKEERIRREHPGLKEVREAAVNETQCPGCRATINPVTGDGYHAPEGEPWAMVCDRCGRRIDPDA